MPSTSPKVQLNDIDLTWFLVILDPGHGGLSPYRFTLPSKYVTYPNKAFKHPYMKPQPGEMLAPSFHGNGWFFEGVWNRILVNKVYALLQDLYIPTLKVTNMYADMSLSARVKRANDIGKRYPHPIYISTHANASALHLARGYEVYSSPGNTKSDLLAEWHYECVARLFGDKIKMRPDVSDGDHDKENRFYVLTKTQMPAILIEHLFFDNYQDALLLMREDVQDAFAYAQVYTVLKYIEWVYKVNLVFPDSPKLTI